MLLFEDWPTELKVLFIVDLLVIGIGVLFHVLGIVLIVSKSSEMSNQSVLLVHLSIATFLGLGTNVYAVHHRCFHILFSHNFIMIFYIAYITYILNLILLTMDRLLMAFLNIRYQAVMTKTKITISLVVVWLLAIGYGAMVKYAPFYKNTVVFVENESFIYNGFVVCFTAFSYMAILVKVKITANEVHSVRLVRENSKKYIIPLVIVLSFFLFNMLPSIIENKIQKKLTSTENRYLNIALIGVNCVNNLVDAIVYIFLQHSIRKRLRRYLRRYVCGRCRHDDEETSDSNEKFSRRSQRLNTSSSNSSSVRGSL